jgi:hypothetical protein
VGRFLLPLARIKVIATFVIGIILLITFIAWEYLMIPGSSLANRFPHQKAMIPLKLLWTRNVGILIYRINCNIAPWRYNCLEVYR